MTNNTDIERLIAWLVEADDRGDADLAMVHCKPAARHHQGGPGMTTATYGQRKVAKMIREMEVLRQAIRSEGTPAIQEAWDKVEEHIDYAYRKDAS